MHSLLNPFLLFIIVLVIAGGYGLKQYLAQQMSSQKDLSKAKKKKLKKQNQQYATYYVYLAIFLILLFGNAPLISCGFVSAVIILGHSAARQRSMKSKVVHFVDVYKDFGPISSLADYICELIEDAQ